jgi:hypothetical protein
MSEHNAKNWSWVDILYLAMVLTALAGFTYIILVNR